VGVSRDQGKATVAWDHGDACTGRTSATEANSFTDNATTPNGEVKVKDGPTRVTHVRTGPILTHTHTLNGRSGTGQEGPRSCRWLPHDEGCLGATREDVGGADPGDGKDGIRVPVEFSRRAGVERGRRSISRSTVHDVQVSSSIAECECVRSEGRCSNVGQGRVGRTDGADDDARGGGGSARR
jgi:hypothetical protein